MICRHCGNPVSSEDAFCAYCGSKIIKPKEDQIEDVTSNQEYIYEAQNDWKYSGSESQRVQRKKHTGLVVVIILLVIVVAGFAGYFFVFSDSLDSSVNEEPISDTSSSNEQESDEINETEEPSISSSGSLYPASNEDFQLTIDGFQPGTYKANYDMNIRKGIGYTAEDTKKNVQKGRTVNIYDLASSTNGSVWGKVSNEEWVCLKDNDYDYFSYQS